MKAVHCLIARKAGSQCGDLFREEVMKYQTKTAIVVNIIMNEKRVDAFV